MVRVTFISTDTNLNESVALANDSTVYDLLEAEDFTPSKCVVMCDGVECDLDDELEDGAEYQVLNKKTSNGCC